MSTKSTGDPAVDALYAPRRGRVEFVEVPELGFLMIDGAGAPGDDAFTDAIQALYSVSYGAHFGVREAGRAAPKVMPLEALWWVVGPDAQETVEGFASGAASLADADRSRWRWCAMIAQLPPIDGSAIEQAIAQVTAKKAVPGLDALRFERWAEGPTAQIMHVGPYAAEPATIRTLHEAIAEHGLRPRGRHHEIYLGNPRTSAPERLRTILRQPVEPAQRSGATAGR